LSLRPAARRSDAGPRAAALGLALLAAAACGGRDGAERVVLVSIDTLRADALGSYGGNPEATPHLDALAARGTRFEHAISPAPLTLPSHATLLTGMDPPEHGVRHNSVYSLPQDVPTLAGALHAAGFATGASVGSFILDRRFGLARGFDHYDDAVGLGRSGRGAASIAERRADRVVDAALAWLAEAPPRFFLFVHFYDPHAGYRPPAPFDGRFASNLYLGEVAFADAQLGRLLEAVAARFPGEDTLVVVTSDHGESRGEHGELSHSYTLYDATQRVPLLLAGPGVPSGRTLPALVRLADVAPTVVALAGAPPLSGASGRSLVPLLAGEAEEPRSAHLETLATRLDFGWSPLLGVRTARHKYLRAPRPELYDLAADPGEERNLAESEPVLVAELDALVEAKLAGHPALAPNLAPDAEARAQLEALGYVVPEPAGTGAGELTQIGGTDPKDVLGEVRLRNQANALLGSGKAAEALARLAPLGDADYETQLLRAAAQLALGDAPAARETARRMLTLSPARAAGHLLLGAGFETEGQLAEAERAYRAAAALEPVSGAGATGLGRLAERRGDRDGAAEWYRTAVAARVPDTEAVWRLAALELEEGAEDEASRRLGELASGELARPDAALRLAKAELRIGRLELALLRVDAGMRRAPEATELLATRAAILEELGRVGEALPLRERVLAAAPESAEARNAVAWDLARLGRDLERARALAREVVAQTKGDPGAVDTLAAVHLAAGEPKQALAAADGALPRARGETRSLLLLRRAEALGRLGRRDEGLAAFAEASAALPPGRAFAEAAERALLQLKQE
jgi:arylsulfatase A-like enzyme/Flp pilus assembly protein TadD